MLSLAEDGSVFDGKLDYKSDMMGTKSQNVPLLRNDGELVSFLKAGFCFVYPAQYTNIK